MPRREVVGEPADVPAAVWLDDVKLVRQVIGTFEGDLNFSTYRDEFEDGPRETLDAKIGGRRPIRTIVVQQVETPVKVVNLIEGLCKSLDSISAS